jgi:hypothetical protein
VGTTKIVTDDSFEVDVLKNEKPVIVGGVVWTVPPGRPGA